MTSSGFRYLIQRYRTCDPAAKSNLEIILLYPGIKAIGLHCLSHRLWRSGFYFLARMVSEGARLVTGIEIHPAAIIGPGLVIDHGMGLVIGETAIVGRDVTLFQGVTLGGISVEKKKRHPTLGDRTVIGAGAKILGDIYLGNDVKIGANSVVLMNIPDGATAVGIPAKIREKGPNHAER